MGQRPVVARSAEPAAEVAGAAFRRSGGARRPRGRPARADEAETSGRTEAVGAGQDEAPRAEAGEAFRVFRPSRAFARRGGDGDDLRPSGGACARLGPSGCESTAFAGPGRNKRRNAGAISASQFRGAGAQRRLRDGAGRQGLRRLHAAARDRRNQDDDRRRRRRNDPVARPRRRILPVRAAAGVRGAGGADDPVHQPVGLDAAALPGRPWVPGRRARPF